MISGLLRLAACLVLVITFIGCAALGELQQPRGGTYPEACGQWDYPERQCAAIVEVAAAAAFVDLDAVTQIDLLPFERKTTLGGGQKALVRFTLADGTVVDQAVTCVGVDPGPQCHGNATIHVSTGVSGDFTCTGEPPVGCQTLPPTPGLDAVAAARPFRLDAIDVSLDHEGWYEIELGTATLPNGYLSERSLAVVDKSPTAFWVPTDVSLEVRPAVPGRPSLVSIYRDPFDGPEPVSIFLVFDVSMLHPPAVLQVREIVVR